MLFNKVNETNKLIKLEKNKVEMEKLQKDYMLVNNRMKQIKKTLQNYSETLKILNSEHPSDFPLQDLKSLINKFKKLEGDLNNEYMNNSLIDSINKNVNELEITLKEDWRKFFENETTSLRNAVISIKNITKNKQNAQIVINALNSNNLSWPLDKAKIEIIRKNINEGKAIIGDLGLNSKIEKFLTKITENRATIFDLDDEILKWIKDKELENNIGLKFTM